MSRLVLLLIWCGSSAWAGEAAHEHRYIEVRIPAGTAPGDYLGTVSIATQGGGSASLPVTVRVREADAALAELEAVLAPVDLVGAHAATPEQAIEADISLKNTALPADAPRERMPDDWYEVS